MLIVYYWLSWNAIPVFIPKTTSTSTTISVIIPARNEEENIAALLTALVEQDFPPSQFEIIVVNDHSTDNTAFIVSQYPWVRLLQLTEDGINSYKKKAIERGIAAARFDLIVTTDADCIPPKKWLSSIAAYKEETNGAFIAAPVVINYESSLVQVFQSIDFMVLQGITGAVVYKKNMSMCNGANMAYTREAFYSVNGFAGIDNIASGDDMLLMHKIAKQYPGQVGYLKSADAIVATQPVKSWKAFFNQRIRWASKAKSYDDKRILPVLVLVYLFNCSLVALSIACLWYPYYLPGLLIAFLAKTLIEYPFFISLARFFNLTKAIPLFLLFQPLHVAYTVISGFFGQFGKYEWKGRRVR